MISISVLASLKRCTIDADQVLNAEVIWLTKQGKQVHVLISYPQTAYRGGHISFAGGKRVALDLRHHRAARA